MSDHQHPENASIREVQAVKDDLLKAIQASEDRLIRHIDQKFLHHEEEHDNLSRRANERHARLDAILHEEEADNLRAEGRTGLLHGTLGLLRGLNEFRWLIALIVGAGAVLLGGIELHIR